MKGILLFTLLFTLNLFASELTPGKYRMRGILKYDKKINTIVLDQGTSSEKVYIIESFPRDKALLANGRKIEIIVDIDKQDKVELSSFVNYLPADDVTKSVPSEMLPSSIEKIKN